MITVDFRWFPIGPGNRVLDLGCGAGRHAFEAYRRGASVTALDADEPELVSVKAMFEAMTDAGEAGPGVGGGQAETVHGDATALPFADATFDRVIAAEVLEHIPDDGGAVRELARVLRPGGIAAVTVPRWGPEKVCWLLSNAYHANEGGHIRIYRRRRLERQLRGAGLQILGHHHAHALHSPYWWLKCLVGPDADHALVRAYHRLLVWDIMKAPRLTRGAERALNPVIGKSLVIYARRPLPAGGDRGRV
ncbi:MAG TPA: class I SAM-dependent methyltransferase [Kineosporiaceae bacterium]